MDLSRGSYRSRRGRGFREPVAGIFQLLTGEPFIPNGSLVFHFRGVTLDSGNFVICEKDARGLADQEDAVDMPYLTENTPLALDRSLDGLTRVATSCGR